MLEEKKSPEEKKTFSFMEKEATRREFLKLAGKTAGGLFVASSVLNLLGCRTGPGTRAFATGPGLLVYNRNFCSACLRCEGNCSLYNSGNTVNTYLAAVRITPYYNFGRGGPPSTPRDSEGVFGNFLMNADVCLQCREPECAASCPVGAITSVRANRNAWVIDQDRCIGCGLCVTACPWNIPVVNTITRKAFKCVLCGMCAEGCPNGALRIIRWEDVRATLARNGLMKDAPVLA